MSDQPSLITVDPEMLTRHVELLFRGTAGFAPIRILKEKDGSDVKNILPFEAITPDLASRVIARALRAADTGSGTFAVPGTVGKAGSAKAADLVQMTCVLVDLDKGDIVAARSHLEAHLGQPSLVVKSGGTTDEGQDRLHMYWRLSKVVSGSDLTRVCELRAILAEKVGGDTAFASAHQPIRLAGTIYGKSKVRRLVEIIDQADNVQALSEIDRAICAMPAMDSLPILSAKFAVRNRGPTAIDLALKEIRSEGRDELTRFEAVGKVIGHWLRQVRSGRITLDDAWVRVQEHNAARIEPPWETVKLRSSFDALLKRDVQNHGPMPDLGRLHAQDGTNNLEFDQIGDGEFDRDSLVPGAVFLSDDDIADRFAQRFRPELRFVASRGCWMIWTGQIWKLDETRKALNSVRMICRVAADTCQRQSKSEPKGSAKCCHFGVGMIAAQACASIRATALVTELAVARMLWPYIAKYLRCWCWLRLVLAGFALTEAVTFAVHLKDVHMVGQPVEECAGQAFGSKGFRPFVEGQVAGDQCSAPLIA